MKKELVKGIKTRSEYLKELFDLLEEIPTLIVKTKGNLTVENVDNINDKIVRIYEIHILLEALNDF